MLYIMKRKVFWLSLFIFFAQGFANKGQAGLIPEFYLQKWEVSLDGFAGLVNTAAGVELRSLVQIDSEVKSQGYQTTLPSTYSTGSDIQDVDNQDIAEWKGIMTISGLKVIAIDAATVDSFGIVTAYTRKTGVDIADFKKIASYIGKKDIIYFGNAVDGTEGKARLFEDVADNNSGGSGVVNAAVKRTFGWDADGSGFTGTFGSSSKSFTIDSGDLLSLEATFADLSSTYVPAPIPRFAPAGTKMVQVLSEGGVVRPIAVLDVIGGLEGYKIIDKAMSTSDIPTSAFDGGPASGTKKIIGDIIASLGASSITPITSYSPGYVDGTADGDGAVLATFSDPAEFVTNPEPSSLILAAIGVTVLGVRSLRRRKEALKKNCIV